MDPAAIADRFPIGKVLLSVPLKTGLIHATYAIASETGDYILQRVSGIFGDEVFEDLENVTNHLKEKGIATFTLIRTNNGERFHRDDSGRWRLMTRIEGEPLSGKPTPEQLEDAGATIGRFHAALADYPHPIRHRIPGFHDTKAYLSRLRELDASETGPKHEALHPLTEEVLSECAKLPDFSHLPLRILHGDPKLQNVLFKDGEAVAVIDLDTVGSFTLATEMGDMLRSWCREDGKFSPEAYHSALRGYRSTAAFATPEEWALMPDSVGLIALELTTRFIIDAYEERYFAHDAAAFPSLFAQNTSAAERQMAYYRDYLLKKESLRA